MRAARCQHFLQYAKSKSSAELLSAQFLNDSHTRAVAAIGFDIKLIATAILLTRDQRKLLALLGGNNILNGVRLSLANAGRVRYSNIAGVEGTAVMDRPRVSDTRIDTRQRLASGGSRRRNSDTFRLVARACTKHRDCRDAGDAGEHSDCHLKTSYRDGLFAPNAENHVWLQSSPA